MMGDCQSPEDTRLEEMYGFGDLNHNIKQFDNPLNYKSLRQERLNSYSGQDLIIWLNKLIYQLQNNVNVTLDGLPIVYLENHIFDAGVSEPMQMAFNSEENIFATFNVIVEDKTSHKI